MNYKKRIISIMLISILIICAISAVSAYTGTGFSHNVPSYKYTSQSESSILNKYNDTSCHIEESGICTKVVDGDTIYVEGVGKVRFVGVNTPEKGVEGSQTSKYFTQKFCLNKRVGLDIDDRKNEDRYGRKLAVVIVNGKNLNEMLLKEGLAEVMYIPPSEFVPYVCTFLQANLYHMTGQMKTLRTTLPRKQLQNQAVHQQPVPERILEAQTQINSIIQAANGERR